MIDTHTHMDGEEFDADRREAVARAKEAGVEKIFVPAIDLKGIAGVVDTCQQFPGYAYPMIGLHPEEVKADWRDAVDRMRTILKAHNAPGADGSLPRFIAIGEVGLDFYWSREHESEQLAAFEEQVRWSIEADLPLMIHCRKAQNEMVAILRRYERQLRRGGVFHCFTGNATEAAQLLSFEGFALGIGGVLTFKKSHLPEVVPTLPLSRIVLETDSPYMAPVPMRGKRNESSFVAYVCQRLAEAYGVTAAEIDRQTTENAERIFLGR